MASRSRIRPPQTKSNPEAPRLEERRTFLRYVGFGVSSLAMGWIPLSCTRAPRHADADAPPSREILGLDFTPPAYPVPLPKSGNVSSDERGFENYAVLDDLVPPTRYRVASRHCVGRSARQERARNHGRQQTPTTLASYRWAAADATIGCSSTTSTCPPRPWLDAYAEVYGKPAPNLQLLEDDGQSRGIMTIDDWRSTDHTLDLDDDKAPPAVVAQARALAETLLSEMGVSVLHVRRLDDGHFEVVSDSTRHRRIGTAHLQNVAAEHAPVFTGPATAILGQHAVGTMCNCSGGTTPWGTFLTCEENIQNQVTEPVDPAGESLTARRRLSFVAGSARGKRSFENPRPSMIDGSGLVAFDEPLDGRKYGWIAEIEPTTGALRKHTALGRFRHENITLRFEPGQPLAAYMGDDRRGGHVWKFVSDNVLERADDSGNTELMTRGTLYAARVRR